jgi:hypothetical protein
VLFATASPRTYAHHLVVAETLARAIEQEALGVPAQLVIRLHPLNFGPEFEASLEEYEALLHRYEHVHLNVPRVLSKRLAYDMPEEENILLGSLLKHCAVLVNVFSTTTLEACLLDRPVVLVGSQAHKGLERTARDAATHVGTYRALDFDAYTHQAEVVKAGAASVARSMAELVTLTRFYLENPAVDSDARRAIAQLECGPTDGHAGARIGRRLAALAAATASGGQPARD